MADFEITFLGTGTSIGVPVIGCDCPVCQSDDPKNKRSRSSIYVRSPEQAWVVDTGPDFRMQCLRERIRHLDAVLYTHSHTDHIMGFDDLRRFTVGEDEELTIYANPQCMAQLQTAFEFAFNGQNRYPGYFKPVPVVVNGPFTLGETRLVPLPVRHGKVETNGYLFQRGGQSLLAYIPDAKELEPDTVSLIEGVDTLIIDGLRETPHPTHLSIGESVEIGQKAGVRNLYLTHFSCEVDYTVAEPALPENVRFAYDGLKISV